MSVFVNQGPWPWPPGRTQTGHTVRRCRRRSFYDDGARRGRLARPTSQAHRGQPQPWAARNT